MRINAPWQRVWSTYSDHESWPGWARVATVTIERRGDPEPNGVGCVRALRVYGLTVFEEITAFEQPARMAYRILRGGIPIRNHSGEVLFEPAGTTTDVTWRSTFESRIPGLGLFWRVIVTQMFRLTLSGLDRHLRDPHAR
jgi:hypothetical protein